MVGQTILNYKIIEKLGEGSMGMVFKARDLTLDQSVTLRFLPRSLSESEIDRARAILEARAASTLSHPNICAVHAIKEYEGQMFLVTDYVEGETLRQKLAAGPVQVRRAVEIGMQVAEGLAILHDHGITHRNIRPGNIMIRKDGVVLVMDLGLLWRGSLAGPSREGIPAGNPSCMSPELVQGHASDQRTDIFSLGVVLYEMLSGRPPFRGNDDAAIMQEILTLDPSPLSPGVEGVDQVLNDIVMECLVRDPEERCQSARELAKDLRRYIRGMSGTGSDRMVKVDLVKVPDPDPPAPARGIVGLHLVKYIRRPPVRSEGLPADASEEPAAAPAGATLGNEFMPFLPWILTVLFLGTSLGFAVLFFQKRDAEMRAVRSFLRPPENGSFARMSGGASGGHFAISPDGMSVTFAATDSSGITRLWVRRLGALRPVPLPGTDEASYPFWSPDGKSIGFFAEGKLKRIDASGGAVRSICSARSGRGATWSDRGVIVFAPSSSEGLSRVPADGGMPAPATTLDSSRLERSHRWPWFLPDGKHFLYLARASSADIVYAGALDGSEPKELLRKHSNVVYANRCLMFIEGGALIAQPFDAGSLEMKGLPATVAEDVLYDPGYGRGEFAVSGAGDLLYTEGGSEAAGLAWFDRAGNFAGFAARSVKNADARISPDGFRVAFSNDEGEGTNIRLTTDLWIYDRTRGVSSRLTTDPGDEANPVWTPDGKQIIFTSNRSGRANPYRVNADGTGGQEKLIESESNLFPTDCSSDGKNLALQRGPGGGEKWSIWILPLGKNRKPYLWFKSDADVQLGKFSPDGRWMAYVSDEIGEQQVFVRPFPGPGTRIQISVHGCNGEAFWRRDGREIYFVALDSRLIAAEVSRAGASLKVGRLREVFDARARGIRSLRGITPDNQRLLGVYSPSDARPADLTLVTGWPSETRKP